MKQRREESRGHKTKQLRSREEIEQREDKKRRGNVEITKKSRGD